MCEYHKRLETKKEKKHLDKKSMQELMKSVQTPEDITKIVEALQCKVDEMIKTNQPIPTHIKEIEHLEKKLRQLKEDEKLYLTNRLKKLEEK